MARDSLFGERIIWTGRPESVATPPILRAFAAVLFVMAGVSVSYALVITLALQLSPAPMLLFALWCATVGAAASRLPRWWQSGVEYVVTEHHVISRRGAFRRTIERRAISFARIFWSKVDPTSGDLELVRAVPTGALRRRLMLRLSGVHAPDRVWAIIRGAEAVAPTGRAERPVSQRLDCGERVVWSAQPRPRWRVYLPRGRREWALISIAAFLVAVVVRMLIDAIGTLDSLVTNGVPVRSLPFLALTLGLTASVLLVLVIAAYIIYDTLIRVGRLVSKTRYVITDKRVLIQRDREELHLDRGSIVEVIHTPTGKGISDVFLVLDGPRARALAASGAFGEAERGPHLRPVLEAVEDAEGVSRIL
ncbi:MAG TPA: hypothetical protein VGJ84_23735, partial [Polyangiaceae bacterium]